ncbi:MAG: hypothetical protein ACTS22_08090 [Phycisphaerales bacterium]
MAKKTTKRKTTKKKARGRRPAAKSGGGGALGTVSSEALQAELARRRREASALQRKRDRLLGQLQDVERQLRDAGLATGGAGGGRRRPRNSSSLVDAMHAVLTGAEMSVTQLADAVQAAGYITTSPNFRTIVNQTLINNKNKFKRVSRGVYTAK